MEYFFKNDISPPLFFKEKFAPKIQHQCQFFMCLRAAMLHKDYQGIAKPHPIAARQLPLAITLAHHMDLVAIHGAIRHEGCKVSLENLYIYDILDTRCTSSFSCQWTLQKNASFRRCCIVKRPCSQTSNLAAKRLLSLHE